MYQVKAQCGYEIQVIGKGEKGLCRICNANQDVVFSGTYDECVSWLNRRAINVIG